MLPKQAGLYRYRDEGHVEQVGRGPMCLAHRAGEALAEALVGPAELAVLVGPLIVGGAVLLPEQLQPHLFTLELLVYVRVVDVRVSLELDDLGKQPPLEGGIIELVGHRSAQTLLTRPLPILADRALRRTGGRRDPLVTQSRRELQGQNFFDSCPSGKDA